MSRIVLTAASRVGCIRSNNEDMVLAYDKLVRSDFYQTEFMTENNEHFVIAVADGMGWDIIWQQKRKQCRRYWTKIAYPRARFII